MHLLMLIENEFMWGVVFQSNLFPSLPFNDAEYSERKNHNYQ